MKRVLLLTILSSSLYGDISFNLVDFNYYCKSPRTEINPELYNLLAWRCKVLNDIILRKMGLKKYEIRAELQRFLVIQGNETAEQLLNDLQKIGFNF